MNPAVVIEDASIVIGHHFLAVDSVTFSIPRGKITGFIGPSGAGKTTLIRAIVGRQRLSTGSIGIFGEAAGSRALRRRISYMTQEQSVYPDLTVRQNLTYFAQMLGVPKAERTRVVTEAISRVDLAEQANQLVAELSGGQRQRVSLAVALLGAPELMVLDEPTVGLDPALRQRIWDLFRELASSGTTIIISSHVMDEAERCDELMLMRDGALLASGTPGHLLRQTGTNSVEQSFLKLVGRHHSRTEEARP